MSDRDLSVMPSSPRMGDLTFTSNFSVGLGNQEFYWILMMQSESIRRWLPSKLILYKSWESRFEEFMRITKEIHGKERKGCRLTFAEGETQEL